MHDIDLYAHSKLECQPTIAEKENNPSCETCESGSFCAHPYLSEGCYKDYKELKS
jgi:hypothetical protein